MNKKELRAFYLEKRDCLDALYRKEASLAIAKALLAQPAYAKADTILCFVSFRSEVDTKGILMDALQSGKKVYCPKVLDKHVMEFYRILDWCDLKPGKYGILEPSVAGDSKPWAEDEKENVCMVIPGAAFDLSGNRIGYGGGFYDYYLSTHKVRCKIGLGFDIQVIEEMMTEATDQKLDLLISEKEVYTFV